MSSGTTILSRRLHASLFILLFISVHVIKDTHIHQDVTPYQKASASKKLNYHLSNPVTDCSICDYNFAKDKDHVYCSPAIAVLPTVHEAFLNRHCRKTFTTARSSGGRAPPKGALS